MVQFNLPDNSKLIKGEDYLLPAEIKNKKKFQFIDGLQKIIKTQEWILMK